VKAAAAAGLGSNVLDALLDELADRLVEKLAKRERGATPRFADARNNPLASSRAFLDAARRGDFPSFKRGREVVARWADVERYIESRGHSARIRTAAQPAIDEDRILLEQAGIRLRSNAATSPSPAPATDAGRHRSRRPRQVSAREAAPAMVHSECAALAQGAPQEET
jgi:hypothetical protein